MRSEFLVALGCTGAAATPTEGGTDGGGNGGGGGGSGGDGNASGAAGGAGSTGGGDTHTLRRAGHNRKPTSHCWSCREL
jgi:hypothetical protein